MRTAMAILHHLRLLQQQKPLFFILLAILTSIPAASPLQSSQAWSLLSVQRLLNYPQALSSWSNSTDPCSSEPSPSLAIVCYEESITQLHISGPVGSPPLPPHFSIVSLFTTLTRLPDLKVLTLSSLGLWGPLPSKIWRLSKLEILDLSSNHLSGLLPQEISFLKDLQTLILDGNNLSGPVPPWIGAFPLLAVLSMKGNSFDGSLPESIKSLENLRVLRLSSNSLTGVVPDLHGLSNLQVLDLQDNLLGPQFPSLQRRIATILLGRNRFTGSLPLDIGSYYLLQHLDVSNNRFVGPLTPALLNLPSIRYLNVSGNRFTGLLVSNLSCGDGLEVVDVSSNLLTGSLPDCLDVGHGRNVSFAMNCLVGRGEGQQHPLVFCNTGALAVNVLPPPEKGTSAHKCAVVATVVVVVVVVVSLVGIFALFLFRKRSKRRALLKPPRRLIEHASTNGYSSKMASEARYVFRSGMLGAPDIPPYRPFSLEDLEAATNNFDSSTFIGDGSDGELYKGRLEDGSLVAIRCLKLKRSQSPQNFANLIELISKLRHRHLVSILGHCFEYYLENATVSRLFLVSEYMPNGTLRKHICEGIGGEKFSWMQRISAAIGVAKGLQFLHGGMLPGLFGNNLNTTNIFLDENFVAKISSYNLPVPGLCENTRSEIRGSSSSNGLKEINWREKLEDKVDIYNFGLILLEIISGKPIKSRSEIENIIHKLHSGIGADGVARCRSLVDPVISRVCSNESLRTVTELCLRCLSHVPMDRPSVEDVLWNLQFAIQVQDSWRGDSQSSEGSLSPSQYPPQSFVTIN